MHKRGTVRKMVKTRSGMRSIAVEKRVIEPAGCGVSTSSEAHGVIVIPYRGPIATEIHRAFQIAPRFPSHFWKE